MPTDPFLAHVRRTARQAADWTEQRNAAIVAAHDAGWSLRRIADAANLSHTAIAKIVAR